MTNTTLAIIGGGIAGLSAAFYAQQAGMDYTLIEASKRWGGKIRTETLETPDGDVLVEYGPDSFISQKPWALQLARELGLNDALLGTNDDQRRTYVLNNGQLRTLPDGMMLIIPTKFAPFASSRLISPWGKLRMGVEALVPARTDDGDESLAEFITRRLGREAVDKLAEPLMSGIYNADAERQSVMATFPRFRTLEKKYGSLTRGMIEAKKKRSPTNKPKVSTFMSFKRGMQTLTDTLVEQLTGRLYLNQQVVELEPVANGYQLSFADGTTQHAQSVILTTPAYVTARLLQPIMPEIAEQLTNIDYVDTGTMSLVYRKTDLDQLPDGFGLVIPRSENRRINAVTVVSTKFDHRAPDDLVVLRVFFGGSRTPQTMQHDDEIVSKIVRDELNTIYNITAQPIATRIVRSYQATPQYDVGHAERVNAMMDALPAGLMVTGSTYRGIGVPDCIHQSQQVIDQLKV